MNMKVTEKYILPIIFLITSLIFIISSFDYGLFFDEHILKWGIAINSLLILTLLYQLIRKGKFDSTMLVLFFIPIMFSISILGAESPESAIQQTLNWTTYVSFFVLLYITRENRVVKKIMPYILYGLFIVLAYFPFLVKLGIFDFQQAFLENRIASVFQYPNTFGAVLISSWLYGIIHLTRTDLKWYHIVFFGFPLSIFAGDLLLTYSRGAFVVLPIAWFIGLLFLKTINQMKYIILSLISFFGGFLIFQSMTSNGEDIHKEILVVLITSLVMAILTYIVLFLFKKEFKLKQNRWTWVIPTSLFILGIGLIIDLFKKGIVFNLLPESLQGRISTINFSTSSVEGRMRFYDQSMEMSKEAPFFGFGGGGWRVLFTKFQDVPFWAKETHNFYLELLLNIGWIGLFVVLAVLLLLFYKIIKNFSETEGVNNKKIILATIPAMFTLLLHGFIDFDFSYGTVVMILFWLITMGLPQLEKVNVPGRTKILTVSVVIGVSIATYFTYQIYTAENVIAEMKGRNVSFSEAEQNYIKAKNKNPWNSDYHLQLAEVYKRVYENNQNDSVKQRINELLEKASHLEPHNPTLHYELGQMYNSIGERGKAIEKYEVAVEYDRFSNEYAFAYVVQNVLHGEDLLMGGKESEGNEHIKKAIEQYKEYEKYIDLYKGESIPDKRDLTLDKRVYLLAGEAYFLLDQFDKAINTLNKVSYDQSESKQEFMRAQAIKKIIADETKDITHSDELVSNTNDKELLRNFVMYLSELRTKK